MCVHRCVSDMLSGKSQVHVKEMLRHQLSKIKELVEEFKLIIDIEMSDPMPTDLISSPKCRLNVGWVQFGKKWNQCTPHL